MVASAFPISGELALMFEVVVFIKNILILFINHHWVTALKPSDTFSAFFSVQMVCKHVSCQNFVSKNRPHDKCSKIHSINAEVPQRSVLGPLMSFILYIGFTYIRHSITAIFVRVTDEIPAHLSQR